MNWCSTSNRRKNWIGVWTALIAKAPEEKSGSQFWNDWRRAGAMHVVLIEPEAINDIAQTIALYDSAKEGLGGEFLEELKILLNRVAENPRLYVHYRRRAHKAV